MKKLFERSLFWACSLFSLSAICTFYAAVIAESWSGSAKAMTAALALSGLGLLVFLGTEICSFFHHKDA